jgi:FeS assembly SUF system regulator
MFKVARLTDYGVVLLRYLAAQKADLPLSARDLAKESGLPLPTVSKLLKLMAKSKIVIATRGMAGGYQLAHHPDQISLLRLIEVFEGTPAVTACLSEHHQACQIDDKCPQRNGWQVVHLKVAHLLRHISLSELIMPEPSTTAIRGLKHG